MSGLSLLLVDDDELDRAVVIRALRRADEPVTVHEVTSGAAALAALQSSVPDVILLDYRLPDVDGLELLQQIRTAVDARIPVLMISHDESESLAEACIDAGAQDLLPKKEIGPRHLVRAISHARRRHELEQQLRNTLDALGASERRFRAIFEASPIGISIEDIEWRWIVPNPALCRMLGYTADELRTQIPSSELTHPDDRDRNQLALDRLVSGETSQVTLEKRYLHKQGHPVWVRLHAARVEETDIDGARVVCLVEDVGEQHAAAEKLSTMATRLENTLDSITDAFFTVDSDWRITYVNREASRVFRQTRASLVGRILWEQFPDLIDTVVYQEYSRAMQDRVTVVLDTFHYAPLGGWFDIRAYPMDDGLAVYFNDVTDKVVMEQRLQEMYRLDSVGQLTGGVAHDFNNLLTVILGNSDLLLESLSDYDQYVPLLEMIRDAARRGSDMTQRLLAFARRQPLAPEAVDLNKLLEQTRGLLRQGLSEDVDFQFDLAHDLWPAFVDAAQLEAATLNLVLNARDAMPQGGRLLIETGNRVLDTDYVAMNPEAEPGDYVLLAVSDTGVGISRDHLLRVFEPFFTTKETGKGTGMGLSMVHGFLKQTGGHIKIYSEVGQGTTVKLYLPRASRDASEADTRAGTTDMGRGVETVLLVEDDDLVLRHAESLLCGLGYSVIPASSGPEALAILEQGVEIDLLFTDVVMPGGMKGPELAARARALIPGLRVLYTSGYTENAIVHHGRLDPGVHLLQKPYRRHDLAQKVREVLAGDDLPLDKGDE